MDRWRWRLLDSGRSRNARTGRCVRSGDASAAHLADVLCVGEVAVKEVLAGLQELGLVIAIDGDPVRYAPTPPDVGFAPLLLGGLEALDRARGAVAELTDEHRAATRRRDANQLVEVITGASAIRQQLRNLQLGTRSEILWFCRAGHVAMASSDNDEEFAMLARGISYRVIYEQELLEEPGMLDNLVLGIRAGRGRPGHADAAGPDGDLGPVHRALPAGARRGTASRSRPRLWSATAACSPPCSPCSTATGRHPLRCASHSTRTQARRASTSCRRPTPRRTRSASCCPCSWPASATRLSPAGSG